MRNLIPSINRIATAAFVACSVLAISPASAQNTSATWNFNGDGNWTVTSNWAGGLYASGVDNTATLGDFITADRVITLDSAIIIGNITAADTTHNYTISGANALTLDVTTGTPTIDVTTSGRTLAISTAIDGVDGLQKSGLGTLILSGTAANTYTGTTVVNAGVLNLQKTSGVTAIGGNLTLQLGSTLTTGTGFANQIADTATVTFEAGSRWAAGIVETVGDVSVDGTVVVSPVTAAFNVGSNSSFTMNSLALLNTPGGNSYSIAANSGNSTATVGAGGLTMTNSIYQVAQTTGSNTARIVLNGNFTSTGTSQLTTGGGTQIAQLDLGGGTRSFDVTGTMSIAPIVINGGITKTGTGTLTLSGANTYAGSTTISAGTVVVANAAAFGTGNVSITGASQINTSGNLTYANAIVVGDTLSLKNGTFTTNNSNPGGTATFSGILSGSSDINLINSFSGNNQTNLFFSNTGNTFTGSVIGPAGNANGADYFRFNSIGDAGTFTFNKSGNRGGVTYAGTSNITFDNREIALGTVFAGVLNGNGIPVNAFQNIGSGTVTFSTDLTPGQIGATGGTFFFDGTNTGNNTFAGVISNPTSGGNLGVGKWGTGRWILSGDSTYLGNVWVGNGELSVTSIATSDTAQPLGQGSLIQLGDRTVSGILEYTGSANATTDKQILLGTTTNNGGHTGAGSILNNGTGSLTFSNAVFNDQVVISGGNTPARTLTLGGSNSGLNTIAGTIQNNTNTSAAAVLVGVTKTGAGTWILDGANTYTGVTTVSGGTLAINGSLGNTAVTVGSGATLQGSGSIAGSVTIQGGGTLATGNSIESMATGDLSLASLSTFAYEIDNDAAPSVAGDLTAVTGNLTLALDDTSILTIAELGSGSWAPGDKLTLISYSGTWNGRLFDYLNNPLADDSTFTFSGIDWTFNYNDTTPGTNFVADLTGPSYVTMVAVPEPSTLALFAAGAALLGLRLARRRS